MCWDELAKKNRFCALKMVGPTFGMKGFSIKKLLETFKSRILYIISSIATKWCFL